MHHSATAPREIWAKRRGSSSIFFPYYIFVFFLLCSIFPPSLPLAVLVLSLPFPFARRALSTVRPNWIGGFAVQMRNLIDRVKEENWFPRLYRHHIYPYLIPITVYVSSFPRIIFLFSSYFVLFFPPLFLLLFLFFSLLFSFSFSFCYRCDISIQTKYSEEHNCTNDNEKLM